MKLMLCELCCDIVAPDPVAYVVRWCACRRHAVWWEDPRAGKLAVHDGLAHGRRAWVLGIHNDLIMFDLNSPELVKESLDRTPETYLFRMRNSHVVKFRPGDTGDTRWSGALPEQAKMDWPPVISAIGLAEGTQQRGSTGQLWEVRGQKWERVL